MSINIDKLSLLATLAPLQDRLDGRNGLQQDQGFADKLEKALGGSDSPADVGNKAKELAEALTLQMMQRSLSLAGEPSGNEAASGSASFASVNALLKAYRSNLASGDEASLPPAPAPSQLREMADDVSAAVPAAASAPSSHTDTAWLDPIIVSASRKYGVDVSLIRAVIKVESNFNPHAVSHAGARGLMQLMPATARSLGVSDSFDPEQNVMGGTRFLKDMLRRYNGDVDAALAAYNWGPGNVDKRPDRLPRETRDYLVRVKQLYASYSG